jgi:two-component system sensor histidine kinase ChiS
MPKAEKGILDLSNWDFEKDGIVALNGNWEFYWEKYLEPKDFTQPNLDKPDYIQRPASME